MLYTVQCSKLYYIETGVRSRGTNITHKLMGNVQSRVSVLDGTIPDRTIVLPRLFRH